MKKFKITEVFGEKREFEITADNLDMAYSKAMKLFNEINKNKIMDEHYYTLVSIDE